MNIDWVVQSIMSFVNLTVMVSPYFFLGTGFGALLDTYLKEDFGQTFLKKGFFSIIYASTLGAILPGCACATMPMAEGLKRKGTGLGTLSAFIVVSPLLGPHTIILTYGMLGLDFTIARIVMAMAMSISVGVVFNLCHKYNVKGFQLPIDNSTNKEAKCCHHTSKTKQFWTNYWVIIKKLGGYFLLGIFIASVLERAVPPHLIPTYIGDGILSYFLVALLGIPIYICEGEEIPICYALLGLGLSQGATFAFMLGAVGTCIPTMIMAQKIIGKRPTLAYIVSWFLLIPLAGFLFSLVVS